MNEKLVKQSEADGVPATVGASADSRGYQPTQRRVDGEMWLVRRPARGLR